MKVFISWSGDRSRAVARLLREFIPTILQAAQVYTSEDDVRAGERWSEDIAQTIKSADVAIACITSDNLDSPWLSFEAGVHISQAKPFIPLLVDISPVDLKGPFIAFQAMTLTRSDMHRLIRSLNDRLQKPLKEEFVDKLFDRLWPEFEEMVITLPPSRQNDTFDKGSGSSTLRRSDREILEELLTLVRQLVVSQNTNR